MIEKKIPSDAVRWAFEIHKDADALLHSRLQGFLAFNALLAGGFFLTAREPLDSGIASAVAVLPCAVGLIIGLLFPRGIARIVEGVIRLKETWLIHDPAYRLYYGDHNVAPDGKVKLGYRFAQGAVGDRGVLDRRGDVHAGKTDDPLRRRRLHGVDPLSTRMTTAPSLRERVAYGDSAQFIPAPAATNPNPFNALQKNRSRLSDALKPAA